MLRAVLLAGGLLLLVAAPPAGAHTRTTLSVVSPAEGTDVPAGALVVRLAGTGGTGAADFRMQLDGVPVDANGERRADSLFLDLRLGPGEQRDITVTAVDAGAHELRLVYAAHGHDARPDVVRTFTAVAAVSPTPTGAPPSSLASPISDAEAEEFVPIQPWLVATAVLVVLGGGVLALKLVHRRDGGL